jgi:hypothetical protein
MAQDLYGLGSAKGFTGKRFFQFCQVIAQAAVLSVKGKPFATTDTGLTIGAGPGTGIGIMGLSKGLIKSRIISLGAGQQMLGYRFPDVADIIAAATVKEMGKATLTSTHAPVFKGAGTIIPGSIPVVASQWVSHLKSQGQGKRFIGRRFPNFCQAVGQACASNFPQATGTVAISGVWFRLPIIGTTPTKVPGGGAGTGTIS